MPEFGVHEAKTHFSRLLARALAGEDVIITRSGQPLVKLVPVKHSGRPNLGFAKGTVRMADDFDELPDWFAAHFR